MMVCGQFIHSRIALIWTEDIATSFPILTHQHKILKIQKQRNAHYSQKTRQAILANFYEGYYLFTFISFLKHK